MSEIRPFDYRIPRVVALVFLAVKLVLLFLAHPFMDETYYFLWGQHPALSYFDHPSLIGWTEGLSGLIFGWSVVGLRVFVALTLIGDLGVLYLFARLQRGGEWQQAFWPTAMLFLVTPIFFGLTNVALPDHLLIFFVLLALYGFERFRAGWEAGAPRWRFLYLAGLAIGLATLSKYTGALVGVGFAALLIASPRLRPVLRTVHPWLAALLALALQAPVLAWNIRHEFASFGFIFGGRAALGSAAHSGIGGFLLGAVAVLSPFLLWPLGRFLLARGDGQGAGRVVFWLSTLGFLGASLFTNILIHWNAVAYAAVLPFLHPYLRSRFIAGGQVVYGAVVAVLVAANFTLLPVLSLVGHADQTSAWSYGWDEVAKKMAEIRAAEPVDFVAATDYALAGPLSFALRDRDVTSLSPRREAFDDWFVPEAHRGDSALIIADRWRPLSDAIRNRFDRIDAVDSIDVMRFGRVIDTYSFYVGHGFLKPVTVASTAP